MWDDVTQAIEHLHENYCKDINKKLFVCSFSLGASWTAMALGKSKDIHNKVTAAACMQPPLCLIEATKNIE